MPLVRTIRNRGATVTVVANGEVLFAGTGVVGRWTNRMSNHITRATAGAAPTNKRPRWAHYGKPLKSTFTSSTAYSPAAMRVDAAIGSSAGHALYVDQGTSDFVAKILPPTAWGAPDLREATWKVPNPSSGGSQTWRAIGGIPVSGQKAQHFFDTGLAQGMAAMGLRSLTVPGSPKIGDVLGSVPEALAGAVTSGGGAGFQASLEQWREWRETGWKSTRPPYVPKRRETRRATPEQRRRWAREASQRYRDRKKRESGKQTTKQTTQAKADKAAFLSAMRKKYGAGNVEAGTLRTKGGYYYVTVRVRRDGKYQFIEVRAKAKVG